LGCSGRRLKQGLPNASLRQANALQTARAPVRPSTPSYTPSLHCFPYTCLPPLPTPLLYMPFANPHSHTPFAHAKADAKLICPRARAVNPSQRGIPHHCDMRAYDCVCDGCNGCIIALPAFAWRRLLADGSLAWSFRSMSLSALPSSACLVAPGAEQGRGPPCAVNGVAVKILEVGRH
jgi:hypothetical protein